MPETDNDLARSYEIGFILKTQNHEGGILQVLKKHKAEITNQKSSSQISLAYPIKKHTSAHFGVVYFRVLPEAVAEIDNELKLDPGILRFLIVQYSEPKAEVPREKPAPKPEKPFIAVIQSPTPTPDVITNEALEEKLEEILK